MMIPRIYLGTMTFGWTSQTSSHVDQRVATQMLERFIEEAIKHKHPHKDQQQQQQQEKDYDHKILIDTARIYAGGKSERMLGISLQEGSMSSLDASSSLSINTKAHPSQPGGLSKDGIERQLQKSLDAMNVTSVDEYFLHQPDTEHSLLESLECMHSLVLQKKIKSIGMSNYAASEMERAFELCEKYDLTKPSVYQGLYNPLNRLVEEELLPLLRKHDCKFVAYNPLAAGLLTGKYSESMFEDENVPKGRFKGNKNYLPRFYTKRNFEAVNIIRKACRSSDVRMVDATYKWLLMHSALDANYGDGVLIGASSLSQLDANLKACYSCDSDLNNVPLPENVIDAFDKAWYMMSTKEIIYESDELFKYWRSYSADMPNRNNLDHGASYNANKVKT